jgi:anti-sigma B factor antagonist
MLQVREQHHPHSKTIALAGQFSRNTTSGIQARILAAKESGCHHIILDFSGVTEIDSTGLGELFLWYHNMRPHHVQISIVKPPIYIRNHLDWSHLSEIVPIYETEQDAIGHARVYS